MANYPSGFTPLEDVNLRAMGSLGEHLGQSIQNIALNKAKQYQQGDLVGKLMSGYNISRPQAELIASDPKNISTFIEQNLKNRANTESSSAFADALNAVANGEDISELIKTKGFDTKQQLALANAQTSAREKNIVHQEKLKPFLHQEAETTKSLLKIGDHAKRMKNILLKHRNKFPNALTANLPKQAQSLIIQNPNVRSYMREGENIITDLSHLARGTVGKYRLQQIENGKININQPIETQLEGLDELIALSDRVKERGKFRNSLKNKQGHYPTNIEDELTTWELAQEDPLQYPQYFKENDRLIDDDGVEYIIRNGEWEPI